MPHADRRGLGAIIPRAIALLQEAGFAVRLRRPRRVVPSLDALVVLRPPACSQLETRLGRRWEQATAAGPDAARPLLRRRPVRVDGWSTEEWLARHARSHGDEGRAIASEATAAVDPTLSATNLLALRTQLVTQACLTARRCPCRSSSRSCSPSGSS